MEILTVLNQVEFNLAANLIQIRLQLLVKNGDAVLSSTWHRTAIGPDTSVEAQMQAVNTNLASMGFPPITQEDIDRINQIKTAFMEA